MSKRVSIEASVGEWEFISHVLGDYAEKHPRVGEYPMGEYALSIQDCIQAALATPSEEANSE